MKKLISTFLIKRGFNRLVKDIQVLNQKKMSAEETIDFVFSKKAELIQPWQFREEITKLAKEIETLHPKVVVEIGTANGGTLFITSRVADENALIISIDLPGGKFGGGYPEWKIPVYSSFARKNQTIQLIRGDSHSDETFQKLLSILGTKKIDYLFIDGDHTYQGAKQDYEKYSTLVRPGGLIGFHDIVIHRGSTCDVYKLWHELKAENEHREFVNNWDQNKFGVGLLVKK
ncbi:MAG: class I SAM-dependent methyltransferase [Bacteroidota bacterium]